MAILQLPRGFKAAVDDCWFAQLSDMSWQVLKRGRTYYAQGYLGKNDRGKYVSVLMHRHVIGAKPGQEVDHINGNGLDNRACNLRLVTHQQNQFNQVHKPVNCTSRFRGVYWSKPISKWVAQIRLSGRKVHIGVFDCEIEAAMAYDAAGLARDPEHFTPNLP